MTGVVANWMRRRGWEGTAKRGAPLRPLFDERGFVLYFFFEPLFGANVVILFVFLGVKRVADPGGGEVGESWTTRSNGLASPSSGRDWWRR